MWAIVAGTLLVGMSSTSWAVDIEIEDPEDDVEIDDSSDINAHGTCAFANVAYTLKITNIYTRNGQQTINTHTVQGTTDSEGIWTDSSSFTVYGAGTWEVQVWLNSDPTEKDSHDGNVGPTF